MTVQKAEIPRRNDPVSDWVARFSAAPKAARIGLSLALLAFIAALNVTTGPELSFSIFYLVPVAFAGVFLSRRAGVLTACASASIWGFLEITTGPAYSAAWIPYWNSAVRLGFFLIVNELIHRLRGAHMRVRGLSRTDGLTGLANAGVFKEHVDRAIAQNRRNGRPFTLAYIDLDRFKAVNDRLGHSEGDQVLKQCATIIAEATRATDAAARLGGDEFGILMLETDADQAAHVLERVATGIEEGPGHRWGIGVTLGAVTFLEPPRSADEAVHLTDTLMYRGKADGRGRILQTTWRGGPS